MPACPAFLLALLFFPAHAQQTPTAQKTPSSTTSTTNPAPNAENTPAAPPPVPTRADILRGAYGPFRANNDLLYYHLDIRVDPEAKSIQGRNEVRFRMLADASRIQLDLTDALQVDRVDTGGEVALPFSRDSGALFIDFPNPLRKGETRSVFVYYRGNPVSKGRFGGLSFEKDPAGRPWIFTADEDDGCSIWWPCKDQW